MRNDDEEKRRALRAFIPGAGIGENMSHDEWFQSSTLRPVIKLQHNLILHITRERFRNTKVQFLLLTEKDKELYIRSKLAKDNKFKQLMIGVIVGQFTVDEYANYIKNSSEFNRRIIAMIFQRLLDSLCNTHRMIDKKVTLFDT